MAVINGTPAADTLVGTTGNDTIKGAAGNDTIDGGLGNDLVIGGLGLDTIQLGGGNDVFQWNQKDADEHVEGGADFDRGEIIGVAGAESMGVSVNPGGLFVTDFTGFGGPVVTLNDVEQLVLRPLGGADFIQVSDTTGTDLQQITVDLAAAVNGAAPDAQADTVTLIGGLGDNTIAATMAGTTITVTGLPVATTIAHVGKTDVVYIDGGFGNDSIDASKLTAGKLRPGLYGNSGDDFILGSDGDDAADGGGGNDIVLLGGGNDRVSWGALAGQDAIEGGTGTDTLLLTADDGTTEIFAVGSRARVFRSEGAMLLDTGGIERIEFHADEFGDAIAVGDLTGTAVKEVVIELGIGVDPGNGQSDVVSLTAGAGNDAIAAKVTGGKIAISGLPTLLTIADADGDRVALDGGAGDDSINMSAVPATLVGTFTLQGGIGNDTLVGGAGKDQFSGSVGSDTVSGRGGSDLADLGTGDDLYLWSSGDGSDQVFGGADFDTLRVTGAAGDEQFLLGSIAGQTQLIHGPDGATLTLDSMERVQLAALGGADVIFVQNLEGTGIGDVAIDLAATVGGKTADTKSDGVAFSGTGGGDTILMATFGSKVVINGLATAASVDHAGKTDIITISGGGGGDLIAANAIAAGKVSLQLIGGSGDDAIVGSSGNDQVFGGGDNDTADLGAGNDVFACAAGEGTDDVDGGAGNDTFKFSGGAGLGHIIVSSDNGEVDVNRVVEGAIANLDNVERIELAAGAGLDVIEVRNLAGTDAKAVAIDLGSAGGTKGDSNSDFVSIAGSAANDLVTIALSAGTLTVRGLPAQVTIGHFETIDSITFSAGDGNDTFSAATVPTLQIGVLGGAGNDRLTGNGLVNAFDGEDGNDTLAGGGGNDSLHGGIGNDRIDGGTGNDGVLGEAGNDYLVGGTGNDELVGGAGNDTITGGTGNDTIYYTDVTDGHDVVMAFDGNPAGGQDVLNLDSLFASLSVPVGDRAGRVSIVDKGASVEIAVDTDGDLSFDLAVATLKTADVITVGQDIFVGL